MRSTRVYVSIAGAESMKGRSRTAVLLTALVLLFASFSGFSKTAPLPTKSTAKQKKAKHNTQPVAQPNPDNTYGVRQGDSLYKIARAHGSTVEALKSANGLSSVKIKAGQTLVLSGSRIAASKKETPQDSVQRSAQNEESAAKHISQLKDQNLISEDESQSTRLRLIEAGFRMIGVRYRFSGGSEKTGFDCSGLVKNLFSQFNIELPRSSREQYKQGERVEKDNLEIGDLVFFSSGGSNPTHVGIYIGNDKFLHAARKARQVVVSDLSKFWYSMRYLGARRVSDLWGDETQPDPEKQ